MTKTIDKMITMCYINSNKITINVSDQIRHSF